MNGRTQFRGWEQFGKGIDRLVSAVAVARRKILAAAGQPLKGHDNRIGQFCTVGPGANVAGGNVIGQGAYIGAGVVVRDHLSVRAEAVVGAGAVVVKPVPANSLVVGVPARVIRTGVNGL